MNSQKEWNGLFDNTGNFSFVKQLFDNYPDGVMILDIHTVLRYYNQAQGRIDDMAPETALGRTLLELYRVGDNTSFPTLHCLFNRQPLIDHACYYYTHLGKLVNSIHNVFPLFSDNGQLTGCVCFIRDFGQLSEQYQTAANQHRSAKPAGEQDSLKPDYTFDHIITQSPAMRQSLEIASMAANSPSSVMLYGETGCGKEMFAQAIHNISRRRDKPFMAINCAAIPESLLEGIIFGMVKGAFTGAMDKPGLMELANNGTIFFDEINSMPYGLQSKILRAVQEQKVRRVGDSKERKVSLKIISATNVMPQKAVAEGTLRADLLYRLGVVMINIPPLRERPGDIRLLTSHFIKKLNNRLGRNITGLSPRLEDIFLRYPWPGNVRELEHALEGAMNLASNTVSYLEPKHFNASLIGDGLLTASAQAPAAPYDLSPQAPRPASFSYENRHSLEADVLIKAFEAANGNAAQAARLLKISPQLMNYKMKKFGLKKTTVVTLEKPSETPL